MQMKRRAEALTYLLLTLTGLLGVVIALADFVGWTDSITEKRSISLVLVTVGVLAVAVGLERAIRFKDIDEQLGRFERLFASHLGCRYYEGHDESYNAAIELCATAQKHVRTLIIGRTAPEKWASAVSERLRESKDAQKPIKFQVTVAFNFNGIDHSFIEAFERRLEIYRKKGVEHLMTLRLLDLNRPLGFDLLIIDRQHVFLGVPSVADEQFLTRAIVFEYQDKLANELVDWYDQVLVRSAVTVDEFKAPHFRDKLQTRTIAEV
jgi:hypothetical protein